MRGLLVAHRGLHDAAQGRVENSPSAFAAAIAAGHGIECDVHLAADDVAVVFHDATLDRLTGQGGPIGARTSAQLGAIALGDTADTIPTLAQLLGQIGGRVPLLVEVKADVPDVAPLCAAVARDLADYAGPVAIMSFDPAVPGWFARHMPGMARGLVIDRADMAGRARSRWRAEALRLARPDFLALDVGALPCRFARKWRARGLAIATWTVRDAATCALAAVHADVPIAEGAAIAQNCPR
ncbi:MAG TPA: glycerophosphodiester phosphodiesterase family protein [Novosphingobium sp.]|nr:glycerophosphodiester phosphodiesterase family protein [Novosphingobium sp.]